MYPPRPPSVTIAENAIRVPSFRIADSLKSSHRCRRGNCPARLKSPRPRTHLTYLVNAQPSDFSAVPAPSHPLLFATQCVPFALLVQRYSSTEFPTAGLLG